MGCLGDRQADVSGDICENCDHIKQELGQTRCSFLAFARTVFSAFPVCA